jgi:hypothetical protein
MIGRGYGTSFFGNEFMRCSLFSLVHFGYLIIIGCVLGLSAVLSGCTPVPKLPAVDPALVRAEAELQKGIAARETLKGQVRVALVGGALLQANAPLCGDKVVPRTGIILAQVAPANRDDPAGQAGGPRDRTPEGLVVIGVIRGSGGQRAGIMPGDVVAGLDGRDIPTGREALRAYAELEAAGLAAGRTVVYRVLRGGARLEVPVDPLPACDCPLALHRDERVSARTDGKTIAVTTGMLEFARSDGDLALVLGHELAHNVLEHLVRLRVHDLGNATSEARLARQTGVAVPSSMARTAHDIRLRELEAEADYIGLYFAARAGFDIGPAPELWRRMAVLHPAGIDQAGSHPSSASRFVAMDRAVEEIRAKQEAGAPLVPEMGE